MSKPIRRRIEDLEQSAPAGTSKIDFSGLTDDEREVCRFVCTEFGESTVTAGEWAELAELAAEGLPFPYPIRGEPAAHNHRLRVLIDGKISRLRWFGFPGHRPRGCEQYLYVGPDGALMRTGGTAVYPDESLTLA
ncbi:hypothetical protein [uncultured Thiodictyon sp.]|uniref:hypothetical protein n=1 Tax=uncultured Thiodictyon sp. TaxID=1846217 RepID=UPI0025D80A41|nr:hypothetical protein [uncultured Thiodictyon sp.]